MTELTFQVAFGDVDPYLIHWGAYPRFMDRGATAALVPRIDPYWLRSNHLGVARFRCSFDRPVFLGDKLLLRSVAAMPAPDRVHVTHVLSGGGDNEPKATGVTEHIATDPANKWAPRGLPFSFDAGDASEDLADDNLPATGGKSVTLHRRVHLRQVDTASLHWLALTEWMDEGTCTLFGELGHSISSLRSENIAFPLVLAEGGLRPGLGIDDQVIVTAFVEAVGRTSLRLAYRLRDDAGTVFGWARTVHVCITRDPFAPTHAPDWLRS